MKWEPTPNASRGGSINQDHPEACISGSEDLQGSLKSGHVVKEKNGDNCTTDSVEEEEDYYFNDLAKTPSF